MNEVINIGKRVSGNSAPTDITLSNNTIAENNSIGDLIGTFTIVGASPAATLTFTTVFGGDDNTDFQTGELASNELRAGVAFDFETPDDNDTSNDYEIEVTATNSEGSVTRQFTITVTDVDEIAPTLSINSAPSNVSDDTPFEVTFEFSEDVTGFGIGDITLSNATASNFTAVDGNTYTADITPDGSAEDITIDVNAGVCQDGVGNDNEAAAQVIVTYSVGFVDAFFFASDSHSLSDAEYDSGTLESPTYEPVRVPVSQMQALYPVIRGGVMSSDYSGSQGEEEQDDVDAHLNQIDVFDAWTYEDILIPSGNHPKDWSDSIENTGTEIVGVTASWEVPFTQGGAHSFHTRIFVPSKSGARRIMTRSNGSASYILFGINGSNKLNIRIGTNSTNYIERVSTVDIEAGITSVGYTWDGNTANFPKLYINGVEHAGTTGSSGTFTGIGVGGTTKMAVWDVNNSHFGVGGRFIESVFLDVEVDESEMAEFHNDGEIFNLITHSQNVNFQGAYPFYFDGRDISGNDAHITLPGTNVQLTSLYQRYIDPLGLNPAESLRDAANRSYPVDGDGRNLMRAKYGGNLDLMILNDINKGIGGFPWASDKNSPVANGMPAGSVVLEAWARQLYYILSNPDVMIILNTHQGLINTTVNTWYWAKGGTEHSVAETGDPSLRGTLGFFVTKDGANFYEAIPIYERVFFEASVPANIILYITEHAHRKIASSYEEDPSRGIEQSLSIVVNGLRYINVGATSKWHGIGTHFGLDGRNSMLEMYVDEAVMKTFTNDSDNTVANPAGEEYVPLRQTVSLPFNYVSTGYTRQTAVRPTTQASSLLFTEGKRNINLSWTAAEDADGYMVVRSTSPITWTPVDSTIYYPTEEVDTDVFVAYIGDGLYINDYGLSANTTYYYQVFAYGAGNDVMLWNTTSPLSDNTDTLTENLLDLSSISETAQVIIDYLDNSIYTFNTPTSSQILTIANQGSLGGNFTASAGVKCPALSRLGIRAKGNSGLLYQSAYTAAGVTEFDIVIVHNSSPSARFETGRLLDFKGAIRYQRGITGKLNVRIKDSVLGYVDITGNGSEIAYDDEVQIIEHLELKAGVLSLYHNNVLVGSASGITSLVEDGGSLALFIDRSDSYLNSAAAFVKAIIIKTGGNFTSRTNVYNHISSTY